MSMESILRFNAIGKAVEDALDEMPYAPWKTLLAADCPRF